MAAVVFTNIFSLTAQRNVSKTQSELQIAIQRLSSGLRINSAKDDAAGIAIATRFTAQIRGLNQAARNAADAISLAQTAEGAIDEIVNNLQRMRELAVQAVNATNSDDDRASLQKEVAQLQAEIQRAIGTKFNGIAIIGSGATSFTFQVGANAGDTITVITSSLTSLTSYGSAVSAGATVSTKEGASDLITAIDAYLNAINAQRAKLGAVQNRFESVIRLTQNTSENLSASRSRIQDADFALETARLTRAQILQQAGMAMIAQANTVPQQALTLLR